MWSSCEEVPTYALLCVVILLVFTFFHWRNAKFKAIVNQIPGPRSIPVLGTTWFFVSAPSNINKRFDLVLKSYGPVVRHWVLSTPLIMLMRARDAQVILQGMTHHAKSDNYSFLHDWLGLGLLTSRDVLKHNGYVGKDNRGLDEKWQVHRKILTPAFHFNILQEFLPIFNKHAINLINSLAKESTAAMNSKGFDIFKYVSLCSVDIICESSMGFSLDAQKGNNKSYVEAISRITEILASRYLKAWLRPDVLFRLSPSKRELDRCLAISDAFTEKVIRERRKYLHAVGFSQHSVAAEKSDHVEGERRRLAFLDLLLAAEARGEKFMSLKDIQDQVATFLFEGHDTVGTSMCWFLFLLGTYPKVQELVVKELVEVFGDSGRVPDMNDLANLKYLERCIKESLRLYPIGAFFERKIEQDARIENYVVPAGCTVVINCYMLHRDPEFWPQPENFDPDRFLPENSHARHTHAYIPFSAGPRNCIGQKYAMLEAKAVMSSVLRRFRVEAAQTMDEVDLAINMILRPHNGLRIRLYDRREAYPNLYVRG